MRDHYEVLGLEKSASQSEIKKAYRQHAKKLHPDRNPGDDTAEGRFKEISLAYDILSDKSKKSDYDQFGHGGKPQFSGMRSAGFDDFFGQRHRDTGRDAETHVSLTFMEGIEGVIKEVNLPVWKICNPCSGVGGIDLGGKCPGCNGSGGKIHNMGGMQFQAPCGYCEGTGKNMTKCVKCNTTGRQQTMENIKVSFPAGAETGASIRMNGKGLPGKHGAGNLFLRVSVDEHPYFTRKGADIHTQGTLTYTQAILGSVVRIETLHGHIDLKIPKGTQYGAVFKASDQGAKIGNNKIGHHYFHTTITIPTEISVAEGLLLEKIAESEIKL